MNTILHSMPPELQKYLCVSSIIETHFGGQKMVFLVEKKDGTKSALKFYNSYNARDIQENDIYTRYAHLEGIPKLVTVHDYNGDVIAEECYIEGTVLSKAKDNYLGKSEKVKALIIGLCNILKPIWLDSIIHRDIKPSNIIIQDNGEPVLIDFGIARDNNMPLGTTTGFQPNSWDFASPEQIMGKKDLIAYRTDFFSLAVLAYFLYYGKLPFGSTKTEVVQKMQNKDLSFSHDGVFGDFFERVFTLNPSDRVRDIDTFIALLS